MKRRVLLSAAFFLACAAFQSPAPSAQEARLEVQALAAEIVYDVEVERGGVLSGFVLGGERLDQVEAILSDSNGARLSCAEGFPAAKGGRIWAWLMAVPSTLAGGEYRLTLQGGKTGPMGPKRFIHCGPVRVKARVFSSERIRFDPTLSRLMTQPDAQKELEARRLRELLERTQPEALWYMGGFHLPVKATRVSAGFADRRLYAFDDGGSSQSLHNGIDLAAPQGTPVAACGSGRVVLAANRILTGMSIVIEHLPGIYSLYYHLCGMEVVEGQWVRRGERIGAVGMSGLATGPHLHWEVRVGGQPVDPLAFVGRPLVDKNRIFRIIREVTLDERR